MVLMLPRYWHDKRCHLRCFLYAAQWRGAITDLGCFSSNGTMALQCGARGVKQQLAMWRCAAGILMTEGPTSVCNDWVFSRTTLQFTNARLSKTFSRRITSLLTILRVPLNLIH
ncbi:unnamed protein product [Pleuronectes platessa]|uniref:Uncharacterized protein n=1 Tax=Pleuronectes platessa TaxID=8262 RepID=A0A9N7YF73_PLEPL|nr:unnamed protein product [Pleuronectes platessa]